MPWRPGDRIPSRPSRPAWARALEVRPRSTVDERALAGFLSTKAWRVTRKAYLAEHPLCERCRAEGLTVPATVVHHRIDRRDRPDLALEWDNLEALCATCHNAETARRQGRRTRDI